MQHRTKKTRDFSFSCLLILSLMCCCDLHYSYCETRVSEHHLSQHLIRDCDGTGVAIPLCFYLYYNPKTITTTFAPNKVLVAPHRNDGEIRCNLWIRDERAPLYTNYSCRTIPLLKNCFLNGRKYTDFLRWRWRPDQCEIPRFRPDMFLDTVKDKTMAFIGDSLARNHMESLLCLLSTAETPKLLERDSEDRNVKWEFPTHNFTIMVLWSQFLVKASERSINGSASNTFDKIDQRWSTKLPLMDYVIFSDVHWFFRHHDVCENDNLVGCIYCDLPSQIEFGAAIRRAFRAALKEVNSCENCRKLHVMVRTYSPPHFENGEWNTGGGCNRTWPVERDEAGKDWYGWEFAKIQIEETENARREGVRRGNVFEVIDVTEMMLIRADGHPGLYWGNRWLKGYSDCVHWCLPGPVDAWSELMFELIKQT